MAKGTDPYVALWVPESYDAFTASVLDQFPPFSEEREKLERFFSSNSHDTELDSAGRVGFPPFLQSHGELKKEVVVAGAGNRLEVWDRERWTAKNDELVSDVREIRSRVSHAAS